MSLTEPTSSRTAATKPAQAVCAAIQDADYATNGAPFDPLIKFVAAFDFIIGGESNGARPMRFYGCPGPGSSEDNFRPRGDFALAGLGDASRDPVMLVAPVPGRENKLAHPVRFDRIPSDAGSGNRNDVDCLWPVPPPGF